MAAPATFDTRRMELQSRVAEARSRTDELFGIVRPEAICDRPVPERHRIIFYLGHLETFDWNLLAQRVLRLAGVRAAFDRPVAFRIGPGVAGMAAGSARARASPGDYGGENEVGARIVDVTACGVDASAVTNGEFVKFVQYGGYRNRSVWRDEDWTWIESRQVQHPVFWRRNGNLWMVRGMFAEIRLPLDWPVYVSHAEASAYARWLGKSLPTESQFHRAAYRAPDRPERRAPCGAEPPAAHH